MAKIVRIWLRMTYRCCGMEWTDEWPTPFKLACPDCGDLIEPFDVAEIEYDPVSKAGAVASLLRRAG